MKKYNQRKYLKRESCCFSSTNGEFGGFSNMCAGFVLEINGASAKTSEALYQAFKFSFHPEVQSEIIEQKSPMTAKMVSRKNENLIRPDWEEIKVEVMRFCLRQKLAQHFLSFGLLLEKSHPLPIVEVSGKDQFWGTSYLGNKDGLEGINALGRLLMELRADYMSTRKYDLLKVGVPDIPDFRFNNLDIRPTNFTTKFIETNLSDEIETK